MNLTPEIEPPDDETKCTKSFDDADFFDDPNFIFPSPPVGVLDPDGEGRLVPALREAAKTQNPFKILARSAAAFHMPLGPEGALAYALADLAVTGRESYKALQSNPLNEASLREATRNLLADSLVQATPVEVAGAVNAALDRAYGVAWALRGPVAQQAEARASLSLLPGFSTAVWIAVSGEDDKPHRPVNVPSPPYEQYEIPVTVAVGAVGATHPFTIRTRFFVASAVEDPAPAAIPRSPRALPRDPVPKIPDGHHVILFVHGHSSGAEEALAIIPHILSAGLPSTKYSVVSIDLPNNGYSESFDHTKIAASDATTYPAGIFDHSTPIQTPILDYIENFIVAFVDALDLITPVKNRFAGVIGGSLGGNLGLRLGRRPLAANPWLKAGIVSWSAASVGPPMVENEVLRQGPDGSMAKSKEEETHDSRSRYFSRVYDESVAAGTPVSILVPQAQPYFWYRDDWEPCKSNHIAASRCVRQEIYNANFRQWHWRVAAEQVIYSHIDRLDHHHDNNPQNTNPYRYELNRVRHLLVAGQKDDDPGLHIYSSTRDLASKMVNTPGTSLFLLNTGHSIHFERPIFLAHEIVDFLQVPKRTDVSFLVPLLLSDV